MGAYDRMYRACIYTTLTNLQHNLNRKRHAQGVDNSMFLTQWFVTLFTNCFPFEVGALFCAAMSLGFGFDVVVRLWV